MVSPALVTPPLGPLCEDTREQLWSCISADSLAVRAAACLNREWRVAAVEHGSPLKLSSGSEFIWKTLDSLARSEFQNVMRIDARDSSLTDEDLRRLGQGLLPSLTSLDASGCQNMTSVGVKALVKGLGARLKEFSQDSTPRHSMCKEMRVTVGTLKAIAAAEQANGAPLAEDKRFRDKISQIEIDLMAVEFTELRALSKAAAGKPPGPEANLLKIRGTEVKQRITELALEAIGHYANPYVPDALKHGWNEAPIGPEYAAPIASRYFNWRKASIYGGSNEIQKGIIAKMVLGL